MGILLNLGKNLFRHKVLHERGDTAKRFGIFVYHMARVKSSPSMGVVCQGKVTCKSVKSCISSRDELPPLNEGVGSNYSSSVRQALCMGPVRSCLCKVKSNPGCGCGSRLVQFQLKNRSMRRSRK